LAHEFVREIGELEAIRTANEKEMQEASDESKLMVAIHFCTQMRTELTTDVHMLRTMRFEDQDLAKTAKMIADFDRFYWGVQG